MDIKVKFNVKNVIAIEPSRNRDFNYLLKKCFKHWVKKHLQQIRNGNFLWDGDYFII